MSDQNLDYAAIRSNIEKGMRDQKRVYRMIFFGMHLVFFVITMLVMWGVVIADARLRDALFNSGLGAALIIILPTIMWATMILGHVAMLYVESGAGEKEMREKLLMREVGEEILRKGMTVDGMLDKPKRRASASPAEHVVLSDDGELVPADEKERLEQRVYKARINKTSDS